MPREVSLQRGVYIVWDSIPVLWELVCSPCFRIALGGCDLGGGRAFCGVAKCCVSACYLVGVVMLLVLLEICIREASSITVGAPCVVIMLLPLLCRICAVIHPGARGA
jgi:hypothetical protein